MGRKRSASSTPEPQQVATPSSLPLSGSLEPRGAIPYQGDSEVSPMVVKKTASSSKKAKTAPGRVRRSNRLKTVVRTTTETEAQEIERVIEVITSTDSEKEEEEEHQRPITSEEEAKKVEEEEEGEEKEDQDPMTAEEEAKEVEEEEEDEEEDQRLMVAEEEANEVEEEDQHLTEEEEAKEMEEAEKDLVPTTNEIGDCLEGLVELCKMQQKTIAEMQAQDAEKASRSKPSSVVDLTYKGLYIASKKEASVLEKENRRLTKELEYARGRYEGVTEALKLSSKSCCCSKPQ